MIIRWLERTPPTSPGELRIKLDPLGRLVWLDVVAPERPDSIGADETDWQALLDAAGFDRAALEEVEPAWLPPRGSDRRRAWTGVYPDAPETAIRIEAASVGGRPVAFRIVEPWTEPLETAEPPPQGLPIVWITMSIGTLIIAAFLAWRNVSLGRGDRRTALRFALTVGALRLAWYVFTHHVAGGAEVATFLGHFAFAAYRFVVAYVFYLALEPYARKLWPRMLTSWVRLFDGRFRDPLVGRDVLIGLSLAASFGVCKTLTMFVGERFGLTLAHLARGARPLDFELSLESLRGVAGAFLAWTVTVTTAMDITFMMLIMFLIARFVMRRDALTLIPLLALSVGMGLGSHPAIIIVAVAFMIAAWFGFFRYGLLVTVVFLTATLLIVELPLTYDLTAWWAAPTWITLGSMLLLAVWSFRIALAGQPVFRDSLLES